MGCHSIPNGVICLPNIYEYEGFTFEWHYWCGPMKLKKDFEPAARQGKKFYEVAHKWPQLTKKQKERTKVYG